MVVFDKQYFPEGHVLQVLLPIWSWYVPAAHTVGVADPTGHLLPMGHNRLADIVGFDVPLGQ